MSAGGRTLFLINSFIPPFIKTRLLLQDAVVTDPPFPRKRASFQNSPNIIPEVWHVRKQP